MVFGFFKKIRKKEPDYDEIKDHVLGEPVPDIRPDVRSDIVEKPFDRENLSFEPVEKGPVERPLFEEKGYERDYEVVDRLRFIENQLSAIRSQLELVNERLKLIENKMRRGY